MVLTDNRFTLKRKQKPVADQKNLPMQFRRVYNGDKDYFKEKERRHMDVSLLFILFSEELGMLQASSSVLTASDCEPRADPALPPLKVSHLVMQCFQWGRKSAQDITFTNIDLYFC